VKPLRAAIGVVALLAIGAALASGGSRADSTRQRYLPESNALQTVAKFGTGRTVTVDSLGEPDAVRADPGWIAAARPLGNGAPAWARRMYRRSLLVLHALTNERTGAVEAGAREGWSYVWPRDAGTVAIALAAAGYRGEARRIVGFLQGLDLDAAARFQSDGSPVDGRPAQGDAAGWIAAAARAAGLPSAPGKQQWRGLDDYQENGGGDFLGNAIASGSPHVRALFETPAGELARRADDPSSGLDSWPLRQRPLRRLGRRRRPLDSADGLDRLEPDRARRAAGRPSPDGRAAPRGHAGRHAARARRRPHRHPHLDHATGLVARLRDPRPAPALARSG